MAAVLLLQPVGSLCITSGQEHILWSGTGAVQNVMLGFALAGGPPAAVCLDQATSFTLALGVASI